LGYEKDGFEYECGVIREEAAIALGEIGAKEAVNPLIQALHDKSWSVHYDAIGALGKIGDRSAIEPIKQCVIETDDNMVRGHGMEVLINDFDLSTAELRETYLAGKVDDEAKAEALGIIIDDATIQELKAKKDIDGLIKALEYEKDGFEVDSATIRDNAADALGEIGAKKAVNPLIQALHDASPNVQNSAIEALGKIGDRRAIEPIKQCVIETDEKEVRGHGIAVLKNDFDLSMAELREIFLASKADEKSKKVWLGVITEDKEPEKKVEGVTFVGIEFRDKDTLEGIPLIYTHEVYSAKTKEQAWEFINTKSVNKKYYYIEVKVGDVDDPEVIVGVDINGTYEI
jgi:HEAT repeat protein